MGKKKNWRTQRSDNLKVRQGVNGRAVSKDDIKSGALLLNKETEEHDEDDIWLEDYMYQNSLGVQSNILQWKKGSDKSFRKLYHGDGRTTLYRKRKMRQAETAIGLMSMLQNNLKKKLFLFLRSFIQDVRCLPVSTIHQITEHMLQMLC